MKSISIERNSLLYALLLACFCCLATLCTSQTLEISKSYINVSKATTGGSIEKGDILEIRACIAVRAGFFDSCAFYDAVPLGTDYVPGSLRVITNEGKLYKQFTDAANDDCGSITGTTIRMHLGFGNLNAATAYTRGRIASNHKPSLFGSACIMIAAYRVLVTADANNTINTGGGSFTYQSGLNPVQTFSFSANTVRVYPDFGMCTNNTWSNYMTAETNGTFGSGRPRNRTSQSATVPGNYVYQALDIGFPTDNSYGISNNTSTRSNYTTSNAWPKPDFSSPTHRVFGLWDIIGDHTNAASPTNGNPAADTVATNSGGYMLVINSAFRNDYAFQTNITGLCPNTYYEVSCWMRNICSKCGCDSNGVGVNSDGYIPTAPGDSSGVAVEVLFEINGIDYYSTGTIGYTGGWVRKGFNFLTGPGQTNFTLRLVNNAPAGSGNDWVMDDVVVTPCTPLMEYTPSNDVIVCSGNPIIIYDTVSSLFDAYTYYQWQRSTNNGSSWTNITPVSGPATPIATATGYQYVVSHTIAPTETQLSDSGNLYRVVVATSSANFGSSSCRFTDGNNMIRLHVLDCGIALGIPFLSFNGKLENDHAVLNWVTGKEPSPVTYYVEKSSNGMQFTTIGSREGLHDTLPLHNYTFTDPVPAGKINYYRIRIANKEGQSSYSRTIQLSSTYTGFSFISIVNPFSHDLRFDLYADEHGRADIMLVNSAGATVLKKQAILVAGYNRMNFSNTNNLPAGMYVLVIRSENGQLQRLLIKQNQ